MDALLPLRASPATSLSEADNGPSEANRPAAELAHERRELRAFLEILRCQLQNCIDVGERAVLSLTGDLMEIDRRVSMLGRQAPELHEDTIKAIDEHLADALARAQFQDTVSQQTKTVIQALLRLNEHVCPTWTKVPPDSVQPCVSSLLRELYESYISEQQRSIHKASLGGAASPAAGLRTNPD